MHFIITGGAGFIGSHLVETLLAENHQVTVIDNLSSGKWENISQHSNLYYFKQDLLTCNPKQFFKDQYDGLVHLAAMPSVVQSWLSPMIAHDNNISATVAAIQLCQQLDIPRLVFASSAAVYGNPMQSLISEKCSVSPISPYGLQKLASEQYITLFSKHLGISSVNLRLFNAFGPRQTPDSPYSGVISIFVRAIQEGRALTVYGDGHQTRDFIYVKDIALAFKQALSMPMQPGSSLVCNIGQGKAISLLNLIGVIKGCFPDWKAEIDFKPARVGDIQHSQADITQASLKLDFTPQWPLQVGLEELIASLAD